MLELPLNELVSVLQKNRTNHTCIYTDIYIYTYIYLLFSRVWLFATPQTAALQAFLSFTISWSLLKLMSIKLVMPSNHLVLCCLLLLLPCRERERERERERFIGTGLHDDGSEEATWPALCKLKNQESCWYYNWYNYNVVPRFVNQEYQCLRAEKRKIEFALPLPFGFVGVHWIGWCPLALSRLIIFTQSIDSNANLFQIHFCRQIQK